MAVTITEQLALFPAQPIHRISVWNFLSDLYHIFLQLFSIDRKSTRLNSSH